MKQKYKKSILMNIIIIFISIWLPSINVFAWSDNGGGRPSYTQAEINQLQADGKWGDKIVFNSISDSSIGNEKNFVGARLCTQTDCGGATDKTVWNAESINVEDDYDFTVEQKVRVVGAEDQTWKDTVDAKIGDKVEFQIQYKNTGDAHQTSVAIKDTLPTSLRYVPGSTYLKNASFPNGILINEDYLTTSGIRIGNYDDDANAYIKFTAEVVENELERGRNILISWAQAGVGETSRREGASVSVVKKDPTLEIMLKLFIALAVISLVIIFTLIREIIRLKKAGASKDKR